MVKENEGRGERGERKRPAGMEEKGLCQDLPGANPIKGYPE